jgi:hypothetical protein
MSEHYSKQCEEYSSINGKLSVTVFAVCNTHLMRFGLKKVLAKTHFDVRDGVFSCSSGLPYISDNEFVLFIVDGNGQPDGARMRKSLFWPTALNLAL